VQGPQARLPELRSKRYLPVGSVVQNIEFRALLAESGAEQLELARVKGHRLIGTLLQGCRAYEGGI
jgi:hypothetical protein